MKINELLSQAPLLKEGKLRGGWTPEKIKVLDTRSRKALKQNAEKVGDKEVLDMIGEIEWAANAAKRQAAALKQTKQSSAKNLDEKTLNMVLQKIYDAIGNSFPDGDPHHELWNWLKKKVDVPENEFLKVLDRAAKLDKFKGYHDLLKQVWQQHLDDNHEDFKGMSNPW